LPTALPLVEPLSEREVEILRLIANGMTNQQIADRLHVVVGTVKVHNHHIFGKLGVSNRVEALARARELNLLS
jgi:LuxR family maltose regulon positive regulatory protein